MPQLWRVLEHESAMVAVREYRPLLRRARWVLRHYPNVMLLADRGFANHDFQLEGLRRQVDPNLTTGTELELEMC